MNTRTYSHAYVHICVHSHTHTHTYTYIHTQTYIYIHTYIHKCILSFTNQFRGPTTFRCWNTTSPYSVGNFTDNHPPKSLRVLDVVIETLPTDTDRTRLLFFCPWLWLANLVALVPIHSPSLYNQPTSQISSLTPWRRQKQFSPIHW
jgi:hypothetical protein